jgi:hypothetical protein
LSTAESTKKTRAIIPLGSRVFNRLPCCQEKHDTRYL